MKLTNILAIIDPTSDNSVLLHRLDRIAGRADSAESVAITAYCCTFSSYPTSDPDMLKKVAIHRLELWLDTLFADLRGKGVNVEYQLDWDPDWRDALPGATAKTNCDLVVKNSYSALKADIQRLAKQIDRAILRESKAPVLLLRSGQHEGNGVVLAALKTANPDDLHKRANKHILEYCKALVDSNPRFELHAVSCYSGSDNFIYPDDLAKYAGIERQRAHVVDDSPVKGIKRVASDLDAEIVFIGSVERKGVAGKMLGNTAEQIIDTLQSDIVAFVERE